MIGEAMGKQKVFLFDIDGTLLHTGGAGTKSLTRSFQKIHGIENAFQGITLDGKTDPEIVKEAMGRHRVKQEIKPMEIKEIFREYIDFLKEEIIISPNYHLMPRVKEMLEDLHGRENILLGIASGNIQQGAEIKLKRGGIYKYFRFGAYGSDAEDRGEVIRKAIKRGKNLLPGIELSKKDFYVIGDTPRDIIFGRQCHATTVGVATGRYSLEELRQLSPDFLLPDLTDYQTLL
jgi:phosphoglycolate phosphatase-like HAD superfamily hydrolase